MFGDSELQKPKLWVGIDQSYSGFGLVWLDDLDYTTKLFDFTKGKNSDGKRLKIIYDNISWIFWGLEHHYDCYIAMEGYAHGAKFNREKLGELGGVVKLAVYEVFKKEPMVVSPTVLKKHTTGNGKASKSDMISAVKTKWNTNIVDNNLADAYALAQYCKEFSVQ